MVKINSLYVGTVNFSSGTKFPIFFSTNSTPSFRKKAFDKSIYTTISSPNTFFELPLIISIILVEARAFSYCLLKLYCYTF